MKQAGAGGDGGLILTVAGGKGGTGKSVFAVHLSLLLARRGLKTVLADLDLGASNTHILLDQKNLRPGFGRLLVDRKLKVGDLLAETPYQNLSYILGDNQVPQAANPLTTQKLKIIRGIKSLPAQAVVCDLGAGSHTMILDFFLASPKGVALFTPELPSVLNAFSFLRQALFWGLSRAVDRDRFAREVLSEFRSSPLGPEGWSVERLKAEMAERSPRSAEKVQAFLDWWRPGLILNQVRTAEDLKVIPQVADLAAKRLSIKPVCLGILPQDPAVPLAVKARRPLWEIYPESIFLEGLNLLAESVLAWQESPMSELLDRVRKWSPAETQTPAAGEPELGLLLEMLPVVDDLCRAASAAGQAGHTALARGLESALNSHLARLARFGLVPVPGKGASFDPAVHQAVAVEKRDGLIKGTVAAEVVKGFTRLGRLVRPAQVVVAD